MMRQITPAEAEAWEALAREHGCVTAADNLVLGRYVMESTDDGRLLTRFVTPIVATDYDEELRRKTEPIMFDRTPTGDIILPGRWWQLTFEKVAADDSAPLDVRKAAAAAAHCVVIEDVYLPMDTDTIEILAPDEEGKMVIHEALPPGTRVAFRVRSGVS